MQVYWVGHNTYSRDRDWFSYTLPFKLTTQIWSILLIAGTKYLTLSTLWLCVRDSLPMDASNYVHYCLRNSLIHIASWVWMWECQSLCQWVPKPLPVHKLNNVATKGSSVSAMHTPTKTFAKCRACSLADPNLSGICQAPERSVLLCYSSLTCLASLPANPLPQAASMFLPFQHVSNVYLVPAAVAHMPTTPLKQAPVKLQQHLCWTFDLCH